MKNTIRAKVGYKVKYGHKKLEAKGNQFIYWRDEEIDQDYLTKIVKEQNNEHAT